jgi:membrane protease YdiL (CAAX protease family)
LLYVLSFFAFAVALSTTYKSYNLSYPWLSPLIIHTVLCLILIAATKRSFIHAPQEWALLPPNQVWAVVPLLVVGAFCGWLFFSAQEPFHAIPIWRLMAFCLWVPIVEEILFRGYFSHAFRTKMGIGIGTYMSALLFSFIHSDASIEGIVTGAAGITLGPLFLALSAEAIYAISKRLEYAIILHGLCNLSAWLVGTSRPELLENLWFFYG